MEKFVSSEPFPPGEYIQEELDERGWTQEDLAQVLGLTRRQIANLLAGDSALTAGTATALGLAFDQAPTTWMNLQVSYELAIAAQTQRDAARRAAIFNKAPIRVMKKRCWLPDVDDTAELESAVCKFLCIGHIEDVPQFAVAARKGTTYEYENSAQVAWYMRARHLAERAPAAVYAENGFEAGMSDLLKLASNAEDVRRVPKVLGDMGIRLVLVQPLARTKIEGVALWLDSSSPVIALSLRYDRVDNFWFNLLHEAVHIKHRHTSMIDMDASETDVAELPEMEAVANSEAASYLISPSKLDSFVKRVQPFFYQSRVVQFAHSQGIHPGIVVGQLHKREILKPFQLRKLLAPIREFILGQTVTDGWGNDLWLD